MTAGPNSSTALAATFASLVVGDAALLAADAYGLFGLGSTLIAHLTLVGVASFRVYQRGHSDCTMWAIGLLTTLIAGPLGAACVLGVLFVERCSSLSIETLNEWYRQMAGDTPSDSASLVYKAIVTGRRLRPDLQGRRSFLRVIEHGTLPEKQALLGLIGLRYHADFFPVLSLALSSPESSVRAQAAAVFVKLKDKFKARLEENLATARRADPPESLACVEWILACTESGFIDAAEARDGRAAARTICENAVAAGRDARRAERLLDRALAAGKEHDHLVQRLFTRGPTLALGLRSLLADNLIALGRHREAHKILTMEVRAEAASCSALVAEVAVIGRGQGA